MYLHLFSLFFPFEYPAEFPAPRDSPKKDQEVGVPYLAILPGGTLATWHNIREEEGRAKIKIEGWEIYIED